MLVYINYIYGIYAEYDSKKYNNYWRMWGEKLTQSKRDH